MHDKDFSDMGFKKSVMLLSTTEPLSFSKLLEKKLNLG
jgi:hypothetical protein